MPPPFGNLPAGYGYTSPTFIEDSHNQLDEIGTFLADAEIAVLSTSIERLHDIEQRCSIIQAKMFGDIGVKLDKVIEACNKVRKKVQQLSMRTASTMYEYMGQAGIAFPSMEQVQADLGIAGSDVTTNAFTAAASQTIPHVASTDLAQRNGIPSVDLSSGAYQCPAGFLLTSIGNGQYTCANPQTGEYTEPLPIIGGDTGVATDPDIPVTVSPPSETPQLPPGGTLTPIFPPTQPGPTLPGTECTYRPEDLAITSGIVQTYQEVSFFSIGTTTAVTPYVTLQGPQPNPAWDCLGFAFKSAYWWEIGRPGTFFPTVAIPPGWAVYANLQGHLIGAQTRPQGYCKVHPFSTGGKCPAGGGTLTNVLVPPKPPPPTTCPQCCCCPCNCQQPTHVPPTDKPIDKPGDKPKPPADRPMVEPVLPQGDEICKAIQDAIIRMGGDDPVQRPPGGDQGGLANILALSAQLATLPFDKPGDTISKLFDAIVKWAGDLINKGVEGLDCHRGRLVFVSLFEAAFRFVDKWTGMIPPQILEQLRILSYTVCQSRLPDGGMADVAYLRGDIDRETWECYHKAAGDHISPAEKIMMAGRAKLDPGQLDKLYRRKLIEQAEYDKLTREAGVLKEEDKKHIHDYNQVFPPQSDVVRFMQRDTADEVNVDWKEVDKVFEEKYKGKVKDWFDALGIDRDLALHNWRAHFHIPSFTMGQQFFFRLRPGADGVDKPFTQDDFRKMLIQDDWHPAFVDFMIATSYKAVTRTDAVRAYMIHSIDDVKLLNFFQSLGYDIHNAGFYVQYHKKRREIADRKASGYPTMRTLVNSYARCEITNQQFRDTAAKIVIDEDQEKAAVEAAKLSRQVWERKQTIGAVRRPFILGILDNSEAIQKLQDADIDSHCIDTLIGQWELLRLRQDKHIQAGKLCQMQEQGIITPAEHVVALIRARWSREDATRIVESCGFQIDERNIRRADALARRQAADMRRAAREAEKLRRLQECGPPACPSNTPGGQRPTGAGPRNPGPSSNGMVPTTPPG